MVAVAVLAIGFGSRSQNEPVASTSPPDALGMRVWHPPALFPTLKTAAMSRIPSHGSAAAAGVQGTFPFHAGNSQPPSLEELRTAPPQLPPSVVQVAAARVQSEGGVLTESEMREFLALTGWEGRDLEEALSVFWKESRFSPHALGDGGRARGIAQLHFDPWARFCGVTAEDLFDPVKNLRCARLVFQYDLDRGQARWTQWSAKP